MSETLWGAHRSREDEAWRFALWSPDLDGITLHLDGNTHPMEKGADGWHRATARSAAGVEYGFGHGGRIFPDPAAREQAGGVWSRSRLVDLAPPAPGWEGRDWRQSVLMEIHIGTFTDEGTLWSAIARLPELAALGVTAVSLMPLGQFAGDRGWGYDGVLPFAVHPAYGGARAMRAFVTAAHGAGLMVLVDVVYNHFGPEGCVQHALCPAFFDRARQTPWGAAIDFGRPEVRDFFLQNAAMWLRDYGADGLRLDAVHQIGPAGDTAFLRALDAHLAALNLGRPVHLVAEDERNLASYVAGAATIRAQWNDDWHHAVHVLLTGEDHDYYAPFAVDPFGDLVTALRDGQVDQGQERPRAPGPRGEPSGHLPPSCFVNSNQTHDQVGNRAAGERLVALAGPGPARVVHALLLLSPFVPMLFMGEEAGARAPFLFFTDFDGDLGRAVREGRRAEFPAHGDLDVPDPNDPATFAASRPYAARAEDADAWLRLTRRVLDLRHAHVVPLLHSGWHGETVERRGRAALHARWRFAAGALEIAFAAGDALPDLSGDVREIFALADAAAGAALRVGVAA